MGELAREPGPTTRSSETCGLRCHQARREEAGIRRSKEQRFCCFLPLPLPIPAPSPSSTACGHVQLDQHGIRPRLLVLAVLDLAAGSGTQRAVAKSNQARHRGPRRDAGIQSMESHPVPSSPIPSNPIAGASAMARGCWANFPAAAAHAGLEAQKKQRFVARSRRCHHERCVALAHALVPMQGVQEPESI